MNKIKDPQDSFSELLNKDILTPVHFKEKIKNGLNGNEIFTNEYIQEITSEYYLKNCDSIKELEKKGIHLNERDFLDYMNCKGLRDILISTSLRVNYGWGIPTENSINVISNVLNNEHIDGLLEIGAGSGLWSALISKRSNKEIIACDIYIRNDTPNAKFYSVLNEDAKKLMKNINKHAILLVWSDVSDMAFEIASELKENNYIILVGPQICTANSKFYDFIENNFNVESISDASCFSGNNDKILVLKKTNDITNKFIKEIKKIPFKLKK